MKEKQKQDNHSNKGVTLVTLAITVIILTILATITFSTLRSDKSMIKEAKDAKNAVEQKGIEEQIEIAILKAEQKYRNPTLEQVKEEINSSFKENEVRIGESGDITVIIGENSYMITGKLDKYQPKQEESGTVASEKRAGTIFTNNTELKDSYGNKVIIPGGFKIAEDSAVNVTEGVVIEDVNYQTTKGSQFVWIPVGNISNATGEKKTIELNRYTFSYPNGEATPCNEEDILARSMSGVTTNVREYDYFNGKPVAKNLSQFKQSVSKCGGYYIGRYEAGDSDTSTARNLRSNLESTMVCKAGQYVYNYVTYSIAATKSRYMYADNSMIESDLMNSYAWDTAIVYIQNFSDAKYSQQVGTQRTEPMKTAQDPEDVKCNIYDMGGNVREWTTEGDVNSSDNVERGAWYGSGHRVEQRTTYAYSNLGVRTSFRPILYIKTT